MAYTRTWDNTQPPGTALANTLDTIIQEFRQDTQQRLSSLLAAGTDIDTDPLQLKPSALGAVSGAVLVCNPFDMEGALGYSLIDNTTGFGINYDVARGIQMPINARVTRIRAYINRAAASTATIDFYSANVPAATVVDVASLGAAAAGFQVLDSGVFGSPFILSNFNTLYMRVRGTVSAGQTVKIYGCQITYDIAAGEVIP